MAKSAEGHRIEVAVGVVRQHEQVLVAKRPWYQGECWEFPGGKVEPGEAAEAALKRELLEEVGIQVVRHEPWFNIEHDYVDKAVRLLVFKVHEFLGEPSGCEGQHVQWLPLTHLLHLKVPEANTSIVKALLA